MTIKPKFLGLIFLTLICCKGFHYKSSNNISIRVKDLPPILDSIKNKISIIDITQTFSLDKESDDSLDGRFIKLSNSQIAYFYSTDKLKYYHDYFKFTSYFYGFRTDSQGLFEVFILNTNYQTAIYLDCFIINREGEIIDTFRPTLLELSNDYSFSATGRFPNDSVCIVSEISSQEIDLEKNIGIIDTTKIKYTISKSGLLIDTVFKQIPDTLYNYYEYGD